MAQDSNFDTLIVNLYDNKLVSSWDSLATQIMQISHQSISGESCRSRYCELKKSEISGEWTHEEECELCELHDQYGNSWTKISFYLIGRTENNVKNHFYSKLRKSLRALNNIASTHLKKQVRPIADVVIYKLSEAIDEGVKNPQELSKQFIEGCKNLKKEIFHYLDSKNFENSQYFLKEKQLIKSLSNFNKIFKPKPKKERITKLGRENLKKGREIKRIKSMMKKNMIEIANIDYISHIECVGPEQKKKNEGQFLKQRIQNLRKQYEFEDKDKRQSQISIGVEEQQLKENCETEKKNIKRVVRDSEYFDILGESRQLLEDDFMRYRENQCQEEVIDSCCQIFKAVEE